MPGPAPQKDALRRDRPSDQASWTHLPFAGRTDPPPAFPLPRPTKREMVIWEEEWRRPQALMWERLGLGAEVALYVRTRIQAEAPKARSDVLGVVQRFLLSLGLTAEGLARRRWIIDSAEEAPSAPVRNDDSDRESPQARLARIKGVVHEGGRSA